MDTLNGPTSQVAEQIRAANEQLLLAGMRQLELADEARSHSRRIDELLASQAGGVLVVDGDGVVVMLNAHARQMLGLPDADDPACTTLLRELDLRRLDDSPLPPDQRPVERLLGGDQFSDVELRLLRRNGDTAHIAFNGSAIGDGDGSGISRAILVLYEVTEKRRLAELQSDYIGLISHDLRAPLNTILGYAELLRLTLERGMPGDAPEWIGRIEHATRQMAAMINDLVESTRLESGTPQLARELVDLKALAFSTVQQLPSPEERERVSVEAPADPLRVSADCVRVSRAITNLISNALKYSPAGAPVTIRLHQEGAEVTLSVEDRGSGIPPESMPRLFQRFYRVDPAARTEGTGLGLYIARLIVEAHGGRIWAESEPGQGSTFSLALPAA